MADNQVEIQVIAKTDLSEVEGLESVVDEIKSTAEEGVELNLQIDQATANLEEATAEVARLKEELEFAEEWGFVNDVEELEVKLAEAEAEAERLGDVLSNLTVDTSGVDEAKSSLEETASTADSLTTALAGIGATAAIENMVTTADNINTSWNRLDLTFANTGVSMDELKSKTSALSDATGRSGGTIRDYFNQMGIAGVTNTDLLTSSFEALSGKAYQTGNSIESMESKMQMMAMTGNASGRMLKNLGISAEDLATAMGVSADEVSNAFKDLTPEERIQAITTAMGQGAEANEMYKNSYEGLKTQAETAMAGLMGAIGQAILPVVIPALQAATSAIKMLTDGFKALPGPVQAIIGGVAGFAAIALTLVGVLGTVGQIVGMVRGGLQALNLISNLSTIATNALSVAQGILNVVMSMNPIMLVVIALVALAAALVWAYYNVDWFREMVDNAWASIQQLAGYLMGEATSAVQWLGDAFNNAGQIMQEAFNGAVEWVMTSLQGLYDYIMTLGGLIPEGVNLTGNQIIDSILAVVMFIQTLPIQLAMIFINIIAQALGFGSNFSQTMISSAVNAVNGFLTWVSQLPSRAWSYLSQVISRAASFATSFASNLLRAGSNAVSQFTSAIARLPDGFRAEVQEIISEATNFVGQIGSILYNAGVNAISSFLNGLGRHSPGVMQREFVAEITEMGERVPKVSRPLIANVGQMGSDIVGAFNPDLTANASLVSGGSTSSGGAGTVVNFYFTDTVVDNDDRMEAIAEYITRRLNWNNLTAGRTV